MTLEAPQMLLSEDTEAYKILKDLESVASKEENWWRPGTYLGDPHKFSRIVKVPCVSKHDHTVRVVFTWSVALYYRGVNDKNPTTANIRHMTLIQDDGQVPPESSIIFTVCQILGFRPDFTKWNCDFHASWPGGLVVTEPVDEKAFADNNPQFQMVQSGKQQGQSEYFPTFKD